MDQRIVTVGILCAICTLTLAGLGCTPPPASPQAAATDSPMRLPSPSAPATSPVPSYTPVVRPTPTSPVAGAPTVAVPAGATAVLAAVRQDLARRTNVTEAQITVIRVEAVNWPDSSLGCPQPGMMYLQVVTPGFRLVLAAGGVSPEYYTEYHTDAGGRFVVCPKAP